MRPVTDRFLATVRGSHAMCARARIVPPGLVGVNPGPLNPDGSPVHEIPIESGDVKLDATADIRATLDLTTDHPWPQGAGDLLTPYGNEVFVERGIVYGDGVREWVSQGYFRLYSVDQAEAPGGPIQLAARDRMSGIIDARPLAPQEFGAGTSVAAIFDYLVGEVYPGAVILFDFDAATTAFPGSHVLEDDRYGFLRDICDSLGKVMWWDYAGRLRVETAPDPAQPVFAVNHGRGGVVARVSRSLDRDAVYNAVVASGEQAGETPPVRAVAFDLNPNSPTYWHGQFGKVPRFYTSTFITTTEQAQNAADAMLARAIGLPYNVDFSMVPNVALEALDPITVSYSDRTAPETHVIESLTIPLDAGGAMSATTKEKVLGGAVT
ncbi:DUF5047 domain-containing protein [Prauserella endophytica]|uniref:DUF5047 domain-containing protein n=1 Tax=Prauserella endophytica TaxID=1592324 RepID=A0ABY2RS37_9PSEU|nr:DUF5047 domain-containing protein [Prauserella endophytica]TKG58045.1 DUF5047 domain-containing protein [Prauserella endophytica]